MVFSVIDRTIALYSLRYSVCALSVSRKLETMFELKMFVFMLIPVFSCSRTYGHACALRVLSVKPI
jgi:hypothetical protein